MGGKRSGTRDSPLIALVQHFFEHFVVSIATGGVSFQPNMFGFSMCVMLFKIGSGICVRDANPLGTGS